MNKIAQRLCECTLLVIEDNRVNAEMLRQQLVQAGYRNIHVAENGKRGLELTKELHPDIVILDMVMPKMNGFEYCQMVRDIPDFITMPIIVQTALENKDDKLRAFTMGASDYITKPINGKELVARVRVHLMNKLLLEDVSERERQMLAELSAAQAMQMRLMPSDEQIHALKEKYRLEIAHHFESSSAMGGDCWNIRQLDETRLAVTMFDFSGHGMAAAINVFRMHTLMQELTLSAGNAGNFLTLLNRCLYPLIERGEFATMFYGVIDVVSGRLEYAAAAAPPILLYSTQNKHREWLNVEGLPLGAVENAVYETLSVAFAPGDALVMFSDCLIETPDAKGEVMCHAMIAALVERALAKKSPDPAAHIMQNIMEKFRNHSDAPLRDDLTLNVYYRHPLK